MDHEKYLIFILILTSSIKLLPSFIQLVMILGIARNSLDYKAFEEYEDSFTAPLQKYDICCNISNLYFYTSRSYTFEFRRGLVSFAA